MAPLPPRRPPPGRTRGIPTPPAGSRPRPALGRRRRDRRGRRLARRRHRAAGRAGPSRLRRRTVACPSPPPTWRSGTELTDADLDLERACPSGSSPTASPTLPSAGSSPSRWWRARSWLERRLSGGGGDGRGRARRARAAGRWPCPSEAAPPGLAVGDRVEAYAPATTGGSLADLATGAGIRRPSGGPRRAGGRRRRPLGHGVGRGHRGRRARRRGARRRRHARPGRARVASAPGRWGARAGLRRSTRAALVRAWSCSPRCRGARASGMRRRAMRRPRPRGDDAGRRADGGRRRPTTPRPRLADRCARSPCSRPATSSCTCPCSAGPSPTAAVRLRLLTDARRGRRSRSRPPTWRSATWRRRCRPTTRTCRATRSSTPQGDRRRRGGRRLRHVLHGVEPLARQGRDRHRLDPRRARRASGSATPAPPGRPRRRPRPTSTT